jgi:hypothetical protein
MATMSGKEPRCQKPPGTTTAPGGFCVPIAGSAAHLEKQRILSRSVRIVRIRLSDELLE